MHGDDQVQRRPRRHQDWSKIPASAPWYMMGLSACARTAQAVNRKQGYAVRSKHYSSMNSFKLSITNDPISPGMLSSIFRDHSSDHLWYYQPWRRRVCPKVFHSPAPV